MKAEDAARIIADKVALSFPRDRQKLFELLDYMQNRAWSEGSWHGMRKHFFVKVFDSSYFVAPNTHSILEALNINHRPKTIRDEWFDFHKNGTESPKGWLTDVVDKGESPVIFQPTCSPVGGTYKIGARVLGSEQETPKITVAGLDSEGNRVTTFYDGDNGRQSLDGVSLALNKDIRVIDNVDWSNVYSIEKTVSLNAVEVYAVFRDRIKLISRMEPEEQSSKLRVYEVPRECHGYSVHGIFKQSKPIKIIRDGQKIMFDNIEALTSLAIGCDYLYFKKEPEKALAYLVNGISALEGELREQKSNNVTPIQVDFDNEDEWESRNY